MKDKKSIKKDLYQKVLTSLTVLSDKYKDCLLDKDGKKLVLISPIKYKGEPVTFTATFALPFEDTVVARLLISSEPENVMVLQCLAPAIDTGAINTMLNDIDNFFLKNKGIDASLMIEPAPVLQQTVAVKRITFSQTIRKYEMSDMVIRCDDGEPLNITVPGEVSDKFNVGCSVIDRDGSLAPYSKTEKLH